MSGSRVRVLGVHASSDGCRPQQGAIRQVLSFQAAHRSCTVDRCAAPARALVRSPENQNPKKKKKIQGTCATKKKPGRKKKKKIKKAQRSNF